jgi:hypothetical protein
MTLAWYREEDYPLLLTLFKDAARLPPAFDTWRREAESMERLADKMKLRAVRVIIDPVEFVQWCAAGNLPLDGASRNTFALRKASDIVARSRN